MGGRSGASGIANNAPRPTVRLSMQFFGRNYTPIWLENPEYGKVMHEINTMYERRYKNQSIFIHDTHIGNEHYIYTVVNRGFNDYIIIARRRVE